MSKLIRKEDEAAGTSYPSAESILLLEQKLETQKRLKNVPINDINIRIVLDTEMVVNEIRIAAMQTCLEN